jgi:hypothetical protein
VVAHLVQARNFKTNLLKGIGIFKNFKITYKTTYLKKIGENVVNIYDSVAI